MPGVSAVPGRAETAPLRIVVCGQQDCATSALIRAISEFTVLPGGGAGGHTLLDRGRITLANGLCLELCGVRAPDDGAAFGWAVPRALGLILLLDGADTAELEACAAQLRGLPRQLHVPSLVALSDPAGQSPGPPAADEVTARRLTGLLGLAPGTPVLTVGELTRASVRDLLLALLTGILDGLERSQREACSNGAQG